MPKLYFASKSGKRVSFNNFLGNRYLYIYTSFLFVGACKRLFHNQKIFNAISTESHVRARITLHLLSSVFTIRLYVPPVSSPLMRGAWSFMVARQDIAAMVTLYIHQGRAPASGSGCATLHSTAKVCIERMANGYALALIYMRGVMFLEKCLIFGESQLESNPHALTFSTFFLAISS